MIRFCDEFFIFEYKVVKAVRWCRSKSRRGDPAKVHMVSIRFQIIKKKIQNAIKFETILRSCLKTNKTISNFILFVLFQNHLGTYDSEEEDHEYDSGPHVIEPVFHSFLISFTINDINNSKTFFTEVQFSLFEIIFLDACG